MERLQRIVGHVDLESADALQSGAIRPISTASPPTSSPIVGTLKAKMTAKIKESQALKAELLKVGDTKIQEVTVEMAINGARSIKSLVTDTSDLDANTGIAYRGKSLYECQRELPKAKGGSIALPEAAFWLLLTGEVPTDSETAAFTQELHRRSDVPPNVMATINTLPTDTHPMTQLAIGMLAMQKHSKFAAKYDEGMKKPEYWEWSLEDSLDLAAKIPVIAATIYRRTFADGKVPAYDSKLDWAANYGNMLGISQDPEFFECMRLYLMLHADHEGGNVSAHTTGLVGSALSDPYYSWAAGLCGLAGPLHGLANQECLEWLMEVQKELKGETPTEANVSAYVEKTLKAGKVIPGFGHAVLRKPDPRYMLEREFALQHCKNDPLFQLVDVCFKTIPPMLEKKGKVKNPYPNVDAHSGQLMYYYKLRDPRYYTVVFAVSRALGCVAQLVWARAIGLPIERPKSVPLDVLQKLASQAK